MLTKNKKIPRNPCKVTFNLKNDDSVNIKGVKNDKYYEDNTKLHYFYYEPYWPRKRRGGKILKEERGQQHNEVML